MVAQQQLQVIVAVAQLVKQDTQYLSQMGHNHWVL